MSKHPDRKKRPKIVLVNRALVLNNHKQILLLQRPKEHHRIPSKWELPGGKLDIGQDITNALEREVLEETGLVVLPTDKIVYWHSEILTSGKYSGLPYIVLVGLVKRVGGKVALSDEHDNFAWVKKDDVLKYDLTKESRAALTVLAEKI